MSKLKIVSFLPAATEMIYMLGLADQLVGRSHECDFPSAAKLKPIVCDCAIDLSSMTAAQIDSAISARLSAGQSLYAIDETVLRDAAPDLLVTQNLCQVCGPAGNEVSQVLKSMRSAPRIIWQSPRNMDEMFEAVRALGEATGTGAMAARWCAEANARIRRVSVITNTLKKVPVAFLEWLDPIYCGGHWIPQMLAWAGAHDRNSKPATDSVRISWQDVVSAQPEVILVAPCGLNSQQALEQAAELPAHGGWRELPAVRNGKVYAVDANSYFARPGPRLIDGVELLAHLIHPEKFVWSGPPDAFRPVPCPARQPLSGLIS